jgi:hypothetical protein
MRPNLAHKNEGRRSGKKLGSLGNIPEHLFRTSNLPDLSNVHRMTYDILNCFEQPSTFLETTRFMGFEAAF